MSPEGGEDTSDFEAAHGATGKKNGDDDGEDENDYDDM
jgi:hypothetical protein